MHQMHLHKDISQPNIAIKITGKIITLKMSLSFYKASSSWNQYIF